MRCRQERIGLVRGKRLRDELRSEGEIVDQGELDPAGREAALKRLDVALVKLQHDVRIERAEAPKQARKIIGREGHEVTEAELAFEARALAAERRAQLLRLGQEVPRLGQEVPPVRRERQPPGVMAQEELSAEHALELGDRRGYRGLRHIEQARRLAHARALGGGGEIGELLQRVADQFFRSRASNNYILSIQ